MAPERPTENPQPWANRPPEQTKGKTEAQGENQPRGKQQDHWGHGRDRAGKKAVHSKAKLPAKTMIYTIATEHLLCA